jgi:hypothetical protein
LAKAAERELNMAGKTKSAERSRRSSETAPGLPRRRLLSDAGSLPAAARIPAALARAASGAALLNGRFVSPRTGALAGFGECDPRMFELARKKLAAGCYWHPTWPYKSPLTGQSSEAMGGGYEQATGRQWTQQLGASIALVDARIETRKNNGAPKNKAEVAKALSTLEAVTPIGPIDFTKCPAPSVSARPITSCQRVKATPGSNFKLDLPTTEPAGDPNVPIGANLRPYDA